MLNRLWREKFLNLKPTLQNEMTGQEERQTTRCLLFVILVQQCICDQNHAGNVDAFIEDHCVDIIEIILKSLLDNNAAVCIVTLSCLEFRFSNSSKNGAF